ncbi:MAG: glycosyl hydrolase 108 family protein [Chthoniobacteraceae bacterium]
MTSNFPKALTFVFENECAYQPNHYGDLDFVVWEDVPGDTGGLTKWGIDQASHPHLDIKALTQADATQIYHDQEWTKCRCDDLPDGYDIAIFDIAVNNGMGTAIQLLQRALNESGDLSLAIDGHIGLRTLAAAHAGGPPALRRLLLERQKHYYDIVTTHPGQMKFLKGWLTRNNTLAALVNINFNAIA